MSSNSTAWPSQLIVPPNSTVEIYCRLEGADEPFWAINLAEDPSAIPLSFFNRRQFLNDFGVFELPSLEAPDMPPTLGLLINDTERNNQTVIVCDGFGVSRETTLFVQGMCRFIIVHKFAVGLCCFIALS